MSSKIFETFVWEWIERFALSYEKIIGRVTYSQSEKFLCLRNLYNCIGSKTGVRSYKTPLNHTHLERKTHLPNLLCKNWNLWIYLLKTDNCSLQVWKMPCKFRFTTHILRTGVHKRLSKVWICEILTIHSVSGNLKIFRKTTRMIKPSKSTFYYPTPFCYFPLV